VGTDTTGRVLAAHARRQFKLMTDDAHQIGKALRQPYGRPIAARRQAPDV
jgi:hypothetical protein